MTLVVLLQQNELHGENLDNKGKRSKDYVFKAAAFIV